MSAPAEPIEAVRRVAQAALDPAAGAQPAPVAAIPAVEARWNTSCPPVLSRRASAGDGGAPAQIGSCPAPASAGASAVLIGGALLGAAGGLVLFCFDPRQYHFYPLCIFHNATGLLCPGCGALRATHQLLHGHLATAFRFNPMLVVSLPLLGWLGARYGFQKLRRQPATIGLRPFWLWLLLAAVLVASVLRNLPGTAFDLVRP